MSLSRRNWTSAGAFFKGPSFDYGTRSALGATAQGIGDAGLVFAPLAKITTATRATGSARGQPRRRP